MISEADLIAYDFHMAEKAFKKAELSRRRKNRATKIEKTNL